jgi:anti-sigma B factor antagonist
VRTRDMRAVPASMPVISVGDLPFTLSIRRDGRHRVVRIGGELDVATRHLVRRACVSGRRKSVVVDMTDMTFMDCCGYGALVSARTMLQDHGGSLTLHNQVGQPAELMTMLALLERSW